MEEKIQRLIKWSTKGQAGPLSLEIWPTNRCNLKCTMCGTWASRRKLENAGIHYNPEDEIKNELSDKKLIQVVSDAIGIGCKNFLITGGGEPFIRKDATLKIMSEIKKHSLFGNLNTNGTLMSSADISQIVKMRWNMIMFSIDGYNAETHDYIRNVSGTFDTVLNVLNEFKRVKNETESENPKIVFNTVITNKNYRNLFNIIELANDVDCEDITFIPLITYDKNARVLQLDEGQSSEFYDLIPLFIDKSKEVDVSTNLEDIKNQFVKDTTNMDSTILSEIESPPNDEFISLPCFEPFLHMLVKPNGEITCCCMVDKIKESVKEKSLKEIWYGKVFQNLRKEFLEKTLPSDCKTCVFSQFVRNKELRQKLVELKTLN